MHVYNKLFKPMFQQLAETCRKKLKFTQDRMAEALYISPRSYRDFKAGKYTADAVTAFIRRGGTAVSPPDAPIGGADRSR